ALRDGETLTPQTAFDRDLVRTFVEQRLLARAAIDEGLQRSTQVSRQVAAARERILAAAYMDQRLAATVTDTAVQRLYNAESDVTRLGDEVRARQIVVRTGEEAEEIVNEINAGASFADLARKYSIDHATRASGGEIGYFTRDMMDPPLAAAAFSTPVGEIATPFETEFGWHILEVEDRRPTAGVPFAAVRDNIRRFLTLRTIEATVDRLKEANDVVYYPPTPPPEDGPEAVSDAPSG
ncbi:MAG TPA: peptidylprolyl isomerase, partial [Parvularculaceae bacterium]|nr:peptidylprolyl isomerase [Parvularculaceae bacterium]